MGLIEVKGIRLYAYHGCLSEEGRIGGHYRVDVAVEGDLARAERTDKLSEQGVEELGKWLKQFGRQVQDPRLASIELDYVVLLNLKDHKAARERFIAVASRIQPGSPIFERVRKLAPAYDDP